MVPQPIHLTGGAPCHVLVVEDDAVIRFILAEALRDAGWSVIEARSGRDAMDYLAAGSRVDIIFSDIEMPGPIDGWQLARLVRAQYPATPVILTSGNAVPKRLDDTDIFVPKPYSVDQVLALLAQALRPADGAP